MNKSNPNIKIDGKEIGENSPTYFIADIAANHDGSLERAKNLIYLAKEAGADAAKFQHFTAETIVSDLGFKSLGEKKSHQASWKKSVFEVYKDASLNLDWSSELKQTCDDVGITFFTSPYSFEIVDYIDKYVPAYKIGSGDITWIELIKYIASKGKPCILASGASSLEDVQRALYAMLEETSDVVLMQCNTNYTAKLENFKYIQLNVLNAYRKMFPGTILGLSDHTPGHSTVLGAVTLGARVIEKHFTDNVSSLGPDHKFSMDPQSWKEMVLRTRELEAALGNDLKKVEDNECDTVIAQRRSIHLANDLEAGEIIKKSDLILLRPCPEGAIAPYDINKIIGRTTQKYQTTGTCLKWTDLT